MSARCPSCLRERIVGHPAGLVFDHGLACPLLAAEDATRAADVERLTPEYGRIVRRIVRAATDTERTLLAACGYTLADTAVTTVEKITPGVLRRTWDGVDLDGPGATTAESDAA